MSKRKYARIFDKICDICGDKANGRNFGAISCESCKAFFRRAMSSTAQIKKCSFDNNCKITPNNRKSCKKCRLDKCFANGMKKELITILNTDNERDSDYKNRIHSEKRNASQYQNLSPNGSLSEDSNTTQLLSDSCLDTIFPDMSDMSTELDFLVNYCLNDEDIPLDMAKVQELLTDSEKSSDINETQVETTTSLLPIVRPINTFDKPLNDLEISRLQELECASDKLIFTKGADATKLLVINSIGQLFEEIAAHNVADPMVMASIDFCKNMSLFQEICEEDKLVLFKKSSWIIMTLKYLPSSNLDLINQTMTFQYDNYKFQINLPNFEQKHSMVYQLGMKFYQNLNLEWTHDPILINLLMAICLFNCEIPDLAHRENVKFNQRMYLYLIQRYLLQKLRTEDKSAQSLAQLMNIPVDLQQMHLYNLREFKDYGHLFSPLVQEVYDI